MLRKRVTTTLFLILAALLLILAVALIALGWTSEASAAPRQQHERNSTHHELKTFEKFLDEHQSIAADLQRAISATLSTNNIEITSDLAGPGGNEGSQRSLVRH